MRSFIYEYRFSECLDLVLSVVDGGGVRRREGCVAPSNRSVPRVRNMFLMIFYDVLMKFQVVRKVRHRPGAAVTTLVTTRFHKWIINGYR